MTNIGLCLMFAERRIACEAAYRAFHDQRLRKYGVAIVRESGPLVAGLDCGAWLGWCPCGAGVGVHPDWSFAGCGCGRTWDRVVFPAHEQLQRIDAVLGLRPAGSINKSPVRFYSWRPDESIADLVRENVRHGWPIPEGAESWP